MLRQMLAAQTPVEGRVIDTATGSGIPDVSVGLLGLGQMAYTATTDTTANGTGGASSIRRPALILTY